MPDPCPVCGAAPSVTPVPLDPPVSEYVSCMTVFPGDIPCPMYAQGIAAWNMLCSAADETRNRKDSP